MWGIVVVVNCLAIVLPVGAFSSREQSAAASAHSPAQKVKHLLLDIEESSRKAAEDEDLAFASTDTYGQQLQISLQNEIDVLNKTRAKLANAKTKYLSEMTEAQSELHHLGAAVQGSKEIASSYAAGTSKVGAKFDDLLVSVKALTALLENAVITPDGTLITPEEPDAHGQPSKVFAAMRQLLSAHASSLTQYKDVLNAFVPVSTTKAQGASMSDFNVKLTPRLLARSVNALRQIDAGLHEKKKQALGQFESRRQKYQSDATATAANLDAQEGVQAENERKANELSFSITFTAAVLSRDRTFLAAVHDHVKEKKTFIDRIGELRSKEANTIKNLVDILEGKYNLADVPSTEKHAEPVVQSHEAWLWQKHAPKVTQLMSFLQTDLSLRKHSEGTSNLQTQIETALRNREDTHDLLMKIKVKLETDSTAALDADNIRDVMSAMQDVLRSLESEQTKAEEAKQKCDGQMYRAKEEEQGLQANVALMSTARDHTNAAIKASKSNLAGIDKKESALQKSENDFRQIQVQSLKTLGDTSRDRATILSALARASEVAEKALPADQAPAIVLLKQLYKYFEEHEKVGKQYQASEKVFHSAFVQYVEGYVQLLKDRESHYEDALASLELYEDELSSDETAQQDSLDSSQELKREDQALCDSIQQFYDAHTKRRQDMISDLKQVLPKVPEILSMDPPATDSTSLSFMQLELLRPIRLRGA